MQSLQMLSQSTPVAAAARRSNKLRTSQPPPSTLTAGVRLMRFVARLLLLADWVSSPSSSLTGSQTTPQTEAGNHARRANIGDKPAPIVSPFKFDAHPRQHKSATAGEPRRRVPPGLTFNSSDFPPAPKVWWLGEDCRGRESGNPAQANPPRCERLKITIQSGLITRRAGR